MVTEPCTGCGGDKTLLDSEPTAVTWRCDVCGVSREAVVES